jgi:hypothetical protein
MLLFYEEERNVDADMGSLFDVANLGSGTAAMEYASQGMGKMLVSDGYRSLSFRYLSLPCESLRSKNKT